MDDAQLTIICTNHPGHKRVELGILKWDAELGLVGPAERPYGHPMTDITPMAPITVNGKAAMGTTGKLRLKCPHPHCTDIPLLQEKARKLFENAEKLGLFANEGRVATVEASLANKLVSI